MFLSRIDACLLRNLHLVAPRARVVRQAVDAVEVLEARGKVARKGDHRAVEILEVTLAADHREMAPNVG
jgi:hypothetical protein